MARNQKLSATITIGAALQQSVKRSLDVVGRGLSKVGDEIRTVTTRQKELDKERRVLERQGKAVDHLDTEYQQLNQTLDRLADRQRRLQAVQDGMGRVGGSFNNMAGEIGRTARNAAIGIGAAGAAVFGLASSTAAAGDELAKQSRALGFNVEAYQELGYAAERSGVSAETFNSSMTAFTKRLGEAAQGSGAAKDALEQLGLSAQDLIDMEPDQALGLIADRMNDIENPADRAALAADLFSRAGIRMTNMLGEGSEGLGRLRQEARDLGLVLSEDSTTAAETYQDSLLNAQSAVQGLRNTIGSALMPVVTRAMDQFTGFMKSNREDVEAFADTVATGLGRALPHIVEVARGVGQVSTQVGSAVAKVAEMVGGWENFGIVLGAVFASKAIASVATFVFTVGKLGGAVLALAAPGALPAVAAGIAAIGSTLAAAAVPIGLALGAIAGGAYLIYQNWGGVKEFFGDLWGNVTDLFGGFGDFVGGVFSGDLSRAANGITQAWQGWSDATFTILNGIGNTFRAVWTDLIKPVTDKLGVTEPIVGAWNAVRDGVGSVLESIGGAVTAAQENAIRPFVSIMTDGLAGIGGAWQGVQSAIGAVLDWITDKFATVMEKIKPVIEALTWVRDKGAGAVGAVTGFFGGGDEPSTGSGGRVQARAVGGSFLPGATLVGERGPELRFESRAGFIATNRQLREMVGRAGRIAALASGIGAAAMPAAAEVPDFIRETADRIGVPAAASPEFMRQAAEDVAVPAASVPEFAQQAAGRFAIPAASVPDFTREDGGRVTIPAAASPEFNQQSPGRIDAPEAIRNVAPAGALRQAETAPQPAAPSLNVAAGAIVINAAPGMDPRAIADTVLGELQRRQRGTLYDGGSF